MKDKYGVLLAISSLPGEQGIGDFGKCAYTFADTIKAKGYKYWQVLPILEVVVQEGEGAAVGGHAGDDMVAAFHFVQQSNSDGSHAGTSGPSQLGALDGSQ